MKRTLMRALCGVSLLIATSGLHAIEGEDIVETVSKAGNSVVEVVKKVTKVSWLSSVKELDTQWKVAGGVAVISAIAYYLHAQGVFSNDSEDLKVI